MVKKITLVILILVLAYLGITFFKEYLLLHPYYTDFLTGTSAQQNRQILRLGVVCAMLPVSYLFFSKKKWFRPLFLLTWWGLRIFQSSYVGIKSDLFSWAAFKVLLNTGFLLGLWTFFTTLLVTIGYQINRLRLRLNDENPIIQFILFLGLGLAWFLLLEYFLLLLNIAFPLVHRLLLLGGVFLIRKSSAALGELRTHVHQRLRDHETTMHSIRRALFGLLLLPFTIILFDLDSSWSWLFALICGWLIGNRLRQGLRNDRRGRNKLFTRKGLSTLILVLLLIVSIRYIYNWFVLAYIPYPTARDANHAYMFIPKMRAYHHGVYRFEPSMRGFGWLRLAFISFWFSLFLPSGGFLGISPDTIAIEMNFRSGIYALIFGVGMVRIVVRYLMQRYAHEEHRIQRVLVLLGRFLILLWLTSGMGAFLVFIDNKTDIGVLSMIILAIFSGFLALRHQHQQETGHESSSLLYKRLMLSGVFYALAAFAKPTAMFDIINFGLFLVGNRFGALGLVALVFLTLSLVILIKMWGVGDYFGFESGKVLGGIGILGVLTEALIQWKKKLLTYGKYLVLRMGTVIIALVGLKLFYLVPDALIYRQDRSIKERVQLLILAQAEPARPEALYAQASPAPLPQAVCSLASEGLSSSEELYKDIKPIVGNPYSEDVGRYVWYGWKGNVSDQRRGIKPFLNPRRANLLGLQAGCHKFDPFFLNVDDSLVLCEWENDRRSFDDTRLANVQANLDTDSRAYELISELRTGVATTDSITELTSEYSAVMQQLEGIMQGNTIKVVVNSNGDKEVYLPYKFLNFFNITFNRSLQNLSSYYTDIGIIRLLLIISAVIGLIYGIIQRERMVIMIHVVTLFGRLLWLIIGGGILWYAIGIIVRTILSFVVLTWSLLRHADGVEQVLLGIFLGLILLIGGKQLHLNMMRISTQGGGGAFMRYKTNYGIDQSVTVTPQGQITPINTPTGRYSADHIFNLQFPHYNKFLRLVNNRKEGEGAFIAGTYARYFINNQTNIIADQFLSELRQRFSDNNVCRSYLRLQDKGLKYIAIDPNIGTVVQGEGNRSLFERFFWRINPVSGEIEQHGSMTMLAALFAEGHLRYVSSNSLWAKYAFTMPDTVFAGLSKEQIIIMRAKMAVARFFSSEQSMMGAIISLADQRVKDGSFIEDLADLLGLEVRPEIAQQVMQGTQLDFAVLTEDEKKALAQFSQIRQLAASQPEQYQQTLQSIVFNSIGAGNQIIVLEVVD